MHDSVADMLHVCPFEDGYENFHNVQRMSVRLLSVLDLKDSHWQIMRKFREK